MAKFRTPKRRQTRQRSGFTVAGDRKGSTCRIERTRYLEPSAGQIVIRGTLPRLIAPSLFTKNIGVVGAGIYIRPDNPCKCSGVLSYELEKRIETSNLDAYQLDANTWQRVGIIKEVNIPAKQSYINSLEFTISLATNRPVSVYGLTIGAIQHEYLIEHDLYDAYKTKTGIYIPEILYLDPIEDAIDFTIQAGRLIGDGPLIVCKSCNRCSRFLPIDISNERNTLAFSNHCVSRAPCKHPAFSAYRIESGQPDASIPVLDGFVKSYFGHQLECIVCKKFFVNLPLNPTRDSTQHREDSLRRRALEVLITELLGKNWIYHSHRMATGKEFDVEIWEKFGRKCFKCRIDLKTPNEMELDHTLPLAYLWPLDTTAACLCPTCNSSKSDRFPVEFYTGEELERLSEITGIPIEVLRSRPINQEAVKRLFERIEWFFDEFLALRDYQKIRNGKKAADLIVHAINNVLKASKIDVDLVRLYQERTHRSPTIVSMES